ncbi:MAG: hypothetical protein M1833_001500 [Piccolia ochrophora]|nr:MAG: hypothetical protein M1833_001500 [Piccolia ochrophora]
MVHVQPFSVEQWFFEHETSAIYNIAETCAASLSIADLSALSTERTKDPLSFSRKLTYGDIRGSEELRSNVARLYSTKATEGLPLDSMLITNGAISANYLVFYSLVGSGDHVICVYPTYQQLYSVPESLGAEVSLWKLREDNHFVPAISDLEKLVRPNTKLIVINNPNNPTGATSSRSILEGIVSVAQEQDIIILSDEVYRPLFHSLPVSDPETPPSILSLGYPKTIATGSLSKAFSLAGIRVGWIASRDPQIIDVCANARDYTTISVSQVDDQIASYALSEAVVPNLLARNIKLAQTNVALLDRFIHDFKNICSWTRPTAGTTAFVKFSKNGEPVDDEAFCTGVQEETGVFICPGGKCFGDGKDFKGYVRLGYVCETEVLREGLEKLGRYLREAF